MNSIGPIELAREDTKRRLEFAAHHPQLTGSRPGRFTKAESSEWSLPVKEASFLLAAAVGRRQLFRFEDVELEVDLPSDMLDVAVHGGLAVVARLLDEWEEIPEEFWVES